MNGQVYQGSWMPCVTDWVCILALYPLNIIVLRGAIFERELWFGEAMGVEPLQMGLVAFVRVMRVIAASPSLRHIRIQEFGIPQARRGP